MAKGKNKVDVDVLIKDLQKKYGENCIYKISNTNLRPIPRLSSGSLKLDLALGGGIPFGRVTEIYGEESSGKSWTCLMVAKEATDREIPVYYVDAEGTLDPVLVTKFGIDPSLFNIVNMPSSELNLQVATDILRSKVTCVIIIDSIAALITRAEEEKGVEGQQVGGNAALITKALRLFQSALNSGNKTINADDEAEGLEATIVLVNQVRDNIGSFYGGLKTTGGRGLKHFASIRVHLRRVEWIEDETDTNKNNKRKIGQIIGAKIVKNKTFAPYREAQYTIHFPPRYVGIDKDEEVIHIAVEKGIIERAGSWYSFDGAKLGQGMDNVIINLKEKNEIFETIKNQVLHLLQVGEV